jgi:hypothetical protein
MLQCHVSLFKKLEPHKKIDIISFKLCILFLYVVFSLLIISSLGKSVNGIAITNKYNFQINY